jgi:hypothetical protein
VSNSKISALTAATTPVAGTEVLPIVQSSATVQVSIANLTAGRSVSMSAGTISSSSLTFSSTAQRIVGDMSNATTANRLIFQTSTVNANTNVTAMPNGTATASLFQALSSGNDPNNCSVGSFAVNGGADVRIAGAIKGTGTYLPIAFHTSGGEKAKIDTNGNVLVTNAGGLGYGTGAGGTVTQATSKATGVTLNKPTGQITMNNALLLTNTTVAFALSNSLIAEPDTLILNITNASAGGGTGGGSYNIWSTPYAGGTNIWLKNISAGSLSEALVVNFSLIKGATA